MALSSNNIKQQAPASQGPMDPWRSDQDTWELVNIPDEDALGNAYPSIGLNAHHFEAGKTYKLPREVAAYVRDRIKAYNRSAVRLLSPKRDIDAQNRVAVGTATSGITAVDPSSATGMGAGAGDNVYTVA